MCFVKKMRLADVRHLQKDTFLLLLLSCEQSSSGGMLKDLPDTLVGFGRAFQVFLGANLLLDIFGLLRER